jgi:2-methylcitrate dehydratase PrpD
MTQDLAVEFAAHACRTRYEDLPPDVVEMTKTFILDTIGAAFAGSSAEGVEAGLRHACEVGGAAQATLMVYGERLPATSAALLNGTMAQARDFDPVYEPGVLLPYGPILPAALAAAELAGAGGKDLINAVVLGTDLTCRIGKSLTGGLGWSRTATLGVFGAALAAARLLGLDAARTVHALGLALSQSAGNIQTVIDGSLAKRYQGGFTAAAGVLAAMLASRGVSGPTNVFEGRCGFFALYESGRYRREVAIEALGRRHEGTLASIKPFPCAREHHGALAAALELHAEGVRAADIDSVSVALPPNAFALSGKPWRRSESPTVGNAISSAAYGVAVALARGAVALEDFEKPALARAEVAGLAERVQVDADSGVVDAKALVPQSVRVRLRGGARRERTSAAMPGSPAAPLSAAQIEAKFSACAARSSRAFSSWQLAALIGQVRSLEQCESVRDFRLHA